MSGHMHTIQLQRRSSRVEKPKSHHSSPRVAERRKTTNESKLYATLDDHYRMMFGMDPEDIVEQRPQPTRPLSWHPSSTRSHAPQPSDYFEPMPQQDWSRYYSASPQNSVRGSDFYSMSTRNSLYEPMPRSHSMHRPSDESDYSLNAMSRNTPGYVHSVINTPTTEPLPWYLQQWAQKNQSQAMMGSHNGSSDFLPIQHPAPCDDTMDEELEDGGERLVALGLYDAPEPSLSWGGLVEGSGKGLKLEETWQPPEANDEDDEDEEDQEEGEEDDVVDDASSEASVEEPSPSLTQQSQQLHLPGQAKADVVDSMEGQSFFFDEDETASQEWWFHQLKQSSIPVRDAGLAYNWV